VALIQAMIPLGLQAVSVALKAEVAAFGLSASSVSRRFIQASARHLRTLCERRLDQDEFVTVALDGKTFAQDAMVIALRITLQGRKKVLGFVQTATENEPVCAAFLRALVAQGLWLEPGLLCVIDEAKGLRIAIQTVFGAKALVQRCQVAQARERCSVSAEDSAGGLAPTAPTGLRAVDVCRSPAALGRLHQGLRGINVSTVTSLDEGLEETLPLDGLGAYSHGRVHPLRRQVRYSKVY